MEERRVDTAGRIRAMLFERGLPHGAFARAVGMDPTALSKALAGRRRFTAMELTRIAGQLNTPLDWLVGNDPGTAVSVPPGPAALSAELYAGEGGKTRLMIIDAAWTLIAERGFHEVRIRDVAQRCAISTAAVHYHFPSRRGMLEEALRVSVYRAYDRQAEKLEAISDPLDRLTRLIELQLPAPGLLTSEWSIWMQVWAESVRDPGLRELHNAAYSRWRAMVRGVISYGQQQDVFTPGDPDELARRLTALMDGLGIQVAAGNPDYSIEHMRATLGDFVRQAILNPQPERTRATV